jgi:hypothetical protein
MALLEIHEKVEVIVKYYYNEKGKFVAMPIKIRWRGREHPFTKMGYPHKFREGRVTIHIFEGSNETTWFRLRHDTETLTWELEAISDGNTN